MEDKANHLSKLKIKLEQQIEDVSISCHVAGLKAVRNVWLNGSRCDGNLGNTISSGRYAPRQEFP